MRQGKLDEAFVCARRAPLPSGDIVGECPRPAHSLRTSSHHPIRNPFADDMRMEEEVVSNMSTPVRADAVQVKSWLAFTLIELLVVIAPITSLATDTSIRFARPN